MSTIIGVSIYAFEAVGIILTVKHSMKKAEKFLRFIFFIRLKPNNFFKKLKTAKNSYSCSSIVEYLLCCTMFTRIRIRYKLNCTIFITQIEI